MTKQDKLTKIIALGKTRYIVQYGVLGWGLATAALFSAWMCYSKGSVRPVDVIAPFILFPLGGIGWGAFMWNYFKKKHDQTLAHSAK